jgi:hypothetical protein
MGLRAMTRACGTCTRCCELVPVKELHKAAFTPCQHDLGAFGIRPGCSIYPNRPPGCRTWRCLWLKDDTWSDELRPDRCGIVVDENIDLVRIGGVESPCAQVWVSPGHEDDFHHGEDAQSIVFSLIEKGLAVLWRMRDDTAICLYRDAKGFAFSAPTRTDSETAEQMLGTPAQRNARAAELAHHLDLGP